MKKKSVLEYAGRKPAGKRKCTITADIVKIGTESYLIADLWKEKAHIYRMAAGFNDYANYDYKTEKWDKKIRWNNEHYSDVKNAYISDADTKKITEFAEAVSGEKHKYGADIFRVEEEVDYKKTREREHRSTLEMETLFNNIPEVPQEFSKLVKKDTAATNRIYYKRCGDKADFTCAQCGETYTERTKRTDTEDFCTCGMMPLYMPQRGEIYKCKKCGESGVLIQAGRAKISNDAFTTLLYQCLPDGMLLIRAFYTDVTRSRYSMMNSNTREYERIFLKRGYARFYIKDYRNTWSRSMYPGKLVETKDVSCIGADAVCESDLRYCPEGLHTLLRSYLEKDRILAKIQALVSYARCPQIETLYKIGLNGICRRILWKEGVTKAVNKKAVTAADALKVTKEDLNWIKLGEDSSRLEFTHVAHRNSIPFKQWETGFMYYLNCHGDYRNLELVLKYLTPERLDNVINRYMSQGHYNTKSEAVHEYADYLKERISAGDDLANDVYLRPGNLYETYTRIRQENELKRSEKYMAEMLEKYPKIADYSKKISRTYTWQQSGYTIRPAKDAGEIVMEGRILHHCVGSDAQGYMKNYNNGRRFILLLRKDSMADKPYITIEIEGTCIRQWYGHNDTKPEEEIIKPLLEQYVSYLESRKRRKTA